MEPRAAIIRKNTTRLLRRKHLDAVHAIIQWYTHSHANLRKGEIGETTLHAR